MLKDITLGQYFPGDTAVHRLDPRVKLILTVLYIAALFTAKDYASYAVVLVFLVSTVAMAKIPPRSLFKGLKPLIFIIIFTSFFNIFYTSGTVIFQVWRVTVTIEGIKKAFLILARIIMLVCGTFMLTYTTSPIALTDGLELLLNPLKKIKVPVHELSMMMSIALRFIPTLVEETDKIMSAQKARGASFDTGGIVQRARALMPLLIPLFVSALRRADELAVAMECRCYNGGEGRTRMKRLRITGRDVFALILGLALLAAVITLAAFGL